MISRKTASIALVLLMTASSFAALLPASGPRAGPALTVTQEWQSGPYNQTPMMMVNDTDGDGQNELLMYLDTFGQGPGGKGDEEHWIKVYDLPAYKQAWGLNLTGSFQLELVDAGLNGSVQFLLTQSDENGTWYELYSGKGYQKLWTSPHFAGGITGRQMLDVDADKALELVFANGSMTGDKENFTFEYRLQIFDLKAGKADWKSAAFPEQVNDLQTGQLDGDAALEIMIFLYSTDENFSTGYGLSVYDGSSHALQWNMPVDMNLTSLDLLDTGDLDGDRTAEVLLDAGQNNGTETSEGFWMLSGADGTTDWSQSFVNASLSMQTADIDNDTQAELLVTESVRDENWNINTTFRIFDLKKQIEVWSMGPFEGSMFMGSLYMTAADLTGDGVPEVLIINYTFDWTTGNTLISFVVIDGKTLAEKWESPTFHGGFPFPLALDKDAGWELLVADSWTDDEGNPHGILHVYDMSAWAEEWKSDDYGTTISVEAFDAVNDSRPEILVTVGVQGTQNQSTTQKLQMIDPDTHDLLWTSPDFPSLEASFPDLYGSPKNEIAFLVTDSEGTGQMPTQTSQLVVFNDTTYAEAWRSDVLEGSGYFEFQGDFDTDGLGELMLVTSVYNPDRTSSSSIRVFEFTEEPPKYVDLAVQSGDLSLSDAAPMAGTKVTLTASVHNLGDGAANCATVALALDGTQIDSRTVDMPPGGTVQVNFTWAARLGDHTLAVKLDPRNAIAEPDETNNNASVSISVGRPTGPVAVIASPTEGQEIPEGEDITFDSSGSYVPEGGNLSWFSEQDGFLGKAAVFNATLPPGDHYVTLYIDDGQNNASAKVNFSVTPAPPPPATTWAVMTSPRNGGVFTTVDRISFDGSKSTAADASYTLTYQWSSNVSGALGTAARFTSVLPVGYHNITLSVDDGHGGSSNVSVSIRVREPPAALAVISSPTEGQSFSVTKSILFDGTNSSSPSGAPLSYVWKSNISGVLGTQRTFWQALAAGSHAITLEVSDGVGANGTATVNITVTAPAVNTPPAVNITSPSNGATVSGFVNITGTAQDDGTLSAVRVTINNESPVSAVGTGNWTFGWNTNNSKYPNGLHSIQITAVDNAGLSTTVSINVTVDNKAPPPPIKPPVEEKDNTMLYIGIAAVAVIAVVGVAAALMMRKK